MKRFIFAVVLIVVLLIGAIVAQSLSHKKTISKASTSQPDVFLGFDRNDYPGDDVLPLLRKSFSFSSYWLNNPPGEKRNSWAGKRQAMKNAGFGFVVLFNGRTYKTLKSDAAGKGRTDGRAAVQLAKREGFSKGTIIFLDQEEGGRLLAEQKAYLFTWVDEVTVAGYGAGVYCSGIPFKEEDGSVITTAEDIRNNASGRQIAIWVTGDACPPSPGCVASKPAPAPSKSGISFADIWQYAQSPGRPQFTASCRQTYAEDGECYAPGLAAQQIHVDIDSALSSDPSRGRR